MRSRSDIDNLVYITKAMQMQIDILMKRILHMQLRILELEKKVEEK